MRVWLRRILIGVALLGAAVVARPAAAWVSLVRDDLVIDRIVVAAALDWRDFGYDKGVERLQYELDRQRVRPEIDERDCVLAVEEDDVRRVHCAWAMTLDLPLADREVELAFQSTARVDRHGVLLR